MDEGAWRAYFNWMRNENKVYEGEEMIQSLRNSYISSSGYKKWWFKAVPPMSPTDRYATAVGTNDVCYVVNKANPRESLKMSDTGKLVKANIPTALARQLLGAAPDDAAPIAAIRTGRGRPAGVANAPRVAAPAVPAVPAAAGDINVVERMDEIGVLAAFNLLPRADRIRLSVTNARRVAPNGDRGAARRNNILGGAGSVGQVISVGESKMYVIRLANQQVIVSINVQPGNRNYILLPNGTMVPLASPAQLLQALQRRNLAEAHQYIVREYLHHNPHHIDEVKELLKKHIAETKNQ
jgi:hypothetical protein